MRALACRLMDGSCKSVKLAMVSFTGGCAYNYKKLEVIDCWISYIKLSEYNTSNVISVGRKKNKTSPSLLPADLRKSI